MSKFTIRRTIDLSELGKGWEGASLTFNGLGVNDLPDSTANVNPEDQFKMVIDALKKNFVSGKAYVDGTGLVDVTAEDIEEFPADVVANSYKLISGAPDPKS